MTSIPTPYRIGVYEKLAELMLPGEVHYILCARSEPDREWMIPTGDFRAHYLRPERVKLGGGFVHFNPDVVGVLREIGPEVIITDQFNPTHLLAFGYSVARGKRHIAMTDGISATEATLSKVHHLVRRMVFRHSAAFVGASEGSCSLYRSYGLPVERIFKSPLCVENERFMSLDDHEPTSDLLFVGRLAGAKNPLFALEVAKRTAECLGRRVTLAVAGGGPQEEEFAGAAQKVSKWVLLRHWGFVQPEDLPSVYRSARVFLFPTERDVWGVVANEAAAAGLPILVSPFAGASGELVLDGVNGRVLPLNVEDWARVCVEVLSDRQLARDWGGASRKLVQSYTPAIAAEALLAAVLKALE